MPEIRTPTSDAPFLESAARITFMGGLNYKVVDNKWDHFRERFRDFDPQVVAALTPEDLEDLAQDAGLIRNAKKLQATVNNARTITEIADEHGSFRAWMEALHDERGPDGAAKELSSRFSYISHMGARNWLWSMGFDDGEGEIEGREKYLLPAR